MLLILSDTVIIKMELISHTLCVPETIHDKYINDYFETFSKFYKIGRICRYHQWYTTSDEVEKPRHSYFWIYVEFLAQFCDKRVHTLITLFNSFV